MVDISFHLFLAASTRSWLAWLLQKDPRLLLNRVIVDHIAELVAFWAWPPPIDLPIGLTVFLSSLASYEDLAFNLPVVL